MNLYAYVGGDPVNRIDPSGLRFQTLDELLAVKPVDGGTIVVTGCGGIMIGSVCIPTFTFNIADWTPRVEYGDPSLGREYGPPSAVPTDLILEPLIRELRDQAKRLYCSLPSFGGGATAGGYAGLGGGVTGEFGFDPSSGRVSLSGGLNVGVGVGFSAAGSANTGRSISSDAVFGSVGANAAISAGPTRFGAAATLIAHSGFNPRYNGLNGGVRAGGGLSANANLSVRGGTAFRIAPGCR
ncbi:MAG: hypothetical protein ACK4K7_11090 [Allosphingosinicella sp.]|uniref:hypothetical protein n=1 Tax=Allosphingosinicella sp. TaxID=2823234 RepID=UPI003936213A